MFLSFAPGLFEVLQSTSPPSSTFFKTLPTDYNRKWAVYLVLQEKKDCQPLIYIGSGTSCLRGVVERLANYVDLSMLPRWVEKAVENGYTVEHRGLLCWTPIPSPDLQPTHRMLMFAIEGTFTFVLWALRRVNSDKGSQFCPWPLSSLTYGGLCSHSAVIDVVP